MDPPRPPPPQHYSHHPPPPPQGQHPPPPHPPYVANPGPPPTLPPIQHNYPPPPVATAPDQPSYLPALRQPAQSFHEARDVPDYHQYNQQNHSGHATPAPVNRSYSHDSAHQQRTPTTPAQPGPYPPTSAPDGQQFQQPPHMDHGLPYSHPPSGLPNGHQNGPPPQAAPPHHDPHGQYAMTPMMENHHGYGPPPPHQSMYSHPPGYGPPTSFNVNVQRKKQMRATQACEQCRQRKQKCDEGNPCSFCKESNLTCTYRDTPPAKTDKNMERVMSFLESNAASVSRIENQMAAQLANQSNQFREFEARLRSMEQERINGVGSAKRQASEPDEPDEPEEPKPVKRRKELEEHRTAPHKLILLWPSVQPLLKDAGVDVHDGYVMEAEDRGVLRLYGRGEGIDETDGTQPGGPASPARSEDSISDNNAPTPPEGIWGRGFYIGTQALGEPNRSHPYTAGGLKPDGSLDLDVGTINSLFDSYMRHMHVMHPILHKSRIREVFDRFISRYSPGRNKHLQNASFAVPPSNNESDRPLKRQRSNGSTGVIGFASDNATKRIVDTERSPQNALVYLVLALGKICAHKEPLPSVVHDKALKTNQAMAHHISGNSGLMGSSPVSANIKPSPISPKLTPTTQPTPPNFDGGVRVEARSRRSSFDSGSPSVGPKNLDVIPGIAYFAKAAEILGDQGDGNDLVHVQMFLLAGLFKGQLARVKESMSWITMAGRAIQILLDRYKLYNDNYWTVYGDVRRQHERGRQRNKDARSNLIVICSWTCLQLESDILAELRLPSSGIQDIENLLLMPHNETAEETYDAIEKEGSYYTNMLYYTAQMYLRRRLNQVHREMYGPECLSLPIGQVQTMLEQHENVLSYWREGLPAGLQWDNNDDQLPSDILAARLRAKYWGARYVISRPFLDYALHIMGHVKDGRTVEECAVDVHGNPRDKAEIHLFKAIQGMGDQAVWDACRRCVDAAMHSTVAFDGVPDRLIVTNIHGTAHAQFGNMLVLAATYYSKHMRCIIHKERFHFLLERTVTFLRRLAPISPTCQNDCGILEKINRLLFGIPADVQSVYLNEGVESISASNSFSANS